MPDPEVSSIAELIKSMKQRQMITKMGHDRLAAISEQNKTREIDKKSPGYNKGMYTIALLEKQIAIRKRQKKENRRVQAKNEKYMNKLRANYHKRAVCNLDHAYSSSETSESSSSSETSESSS